MASNIYALATGPPHYPEYAMLPTTTMISDSPSPHLHTHNPFDSAPQPHSYDIDAQLYDALGGLSTSTISVDSPSPSSAGSAGHALQFPTPLYPRGYSGLTLADVSDMRMADTLAFVLSEICAAADPHAPIPVPSDPAALFFSPHKQKSFTLSYYCQRLLQYNCCSKSCLLVAIVYLARLSDRYPIFKLNEYNVHRLICTAIMLAAKWLDDVSYSVAHYAKVGGIQNGAEMATLEGFMLKALDYRLFVSKENFEAMEKHMVQIALSDL